MFEHIPGVGFVPPRTGCPSSPARLAVVFAMQAGLVIVLLALGLSWPVAVAVPVLLLVADRLVLTASTAGLRAMLTGWARSAGTGLPPGTV